MPQSQPNTGFGSQGFDLGAFLKSISQGDPNNPMQNWQGTNSNQSTAYQDGVNKALKNLGEQHANEAVQAGVDPQQIQAHPLMGQPAETQGSPQSQQVDPMQVLTTLIASQMNQGQQPQPTAQIQQNIPKQGMFETNKNYGIALNNVATTQKIQAGQPGEIGLPQAQTAETMAGVGLKKSISKFLDKGAQIMSINPNTGEIGNANDPASVRFLVAPTLAGPTYVPLDKNQDLTSHLTQLDTLLKNEGELRSTWQKFLNSQTPQMKNIRQLITDTTTKYNQRMGTGQYKSSGKSSFKVTPVN